MMHMNGLDLNDLYVGGTHFTPGVMGTSIGGAITTCEGYTDTQVGNAISTCETYTNVKVNDMAPLNWQQSVLDLVPVLPGTPTNGDRYILVTVPPGGSHDNNICQWSSGTSSWIYTAPSPYIAVYCYSSGGTHNFMYFLYTETLTPHCWTPFGTVIDHYNLLNIGTNTHAQIDSHIGTTTTDPHAGQDLRSSASPTFVMVNSYVNDTTSGTAISGYHKTVDLRSTAVASNLVNFDCTPTTVSPQPSFKINVSSNGSDAHYTAKIVTTSMDYLWVNNVLRLSDPTENYFSNLTCSSAGLAIDQPLSLGAHVLTCQGVTNSGTDSTNTVSPYSGGTVTVSGGDLSVTNTTAASSTTGAIKTLGGISSQVATGIGLYVASTDNSSSSSTGCAIFKGGIGVSNNVFAPTFQASTGIYSNTFYPNTGSEIDYYVGATSIGSWHQDSVTSTTLNIKGPVAGPCHFQNDTGNLVIFSSGTVKVDSGSVLYAYNTTASASSTGSIISSGGITSTLATGIGLYVASTDDSTTVSTGCAVLKGGLGVAKAIFCGSVSCGGNINASGFLTCTGTTDASSKTTGALQSLGGFGCSKTIWCHDLVVDDTTASSSVSTGCGIFSGGLGASGNINSGGYVASSGTFKSGLQSKNFIHITSPQGGGSTTLWSLSGLGGSTFLILDVSIACATPVVGNFMQNFKYRVGLTNGNVSMETPSIFSIGVGSCNTPTASYAAGVLSIVVANSGTFDQDFCGSVQVEQWI